jgi:hypothetical protein
MNTCQLVRRDSVLTSDWALLTSRVAYRKYQYTSKLSLRAYHITSSRGGPPLGRTHVHKAAWDSNGENLSRG